MEKMDNPYIDVSLKQARKLKQVIDKLAVWEAKKKKIIDSPDYAADMMGDFFNEQEDYPAQISLQQQIDQLIYGLTSFKIGHEDGEEWVPEDEIDKETFVKLKTATPDNATIKETIKEIKTMGKELL
jgi:hypothetical protein